VKPHPFIFLILFSLLSLLAFSTPVFANSTPTPVFSWDISADADSSVSASLYEVTDGEYRIEIYGVGEMKDFSDSAPPPWLEYSGEIVFAHVGEKVKNLGKLAFNDCLNLEKLVVEGTFVKIPADVFPIPEETEILAHVNSSIGKYLLINSPERFSPLCKFVDAVCTACSYQCTEHKGGAADCTHGAVCEICGSEYEKRKDHNLSEMIPEKPSDCTNEGMKSHYVCLACGLYFDSEENEVSEESLIIPIAHKLGSLVPYTPPTCTESGNVAYYSCTLCGDAFDASGNAIDKVILSATGHSGGVANCTSCAICDKCGKPYGSVDSSSHSFSGEYYKNESHHWLECACGEIKDRSAHSYEERIVTPATAEECGVKEFSCACGYKYEQSIPKLDLPQENEPDYKNKTDKTVWIIIATGALLTVASVVVIVIIILRKKKKK